LRVTVCAWGKKKAMKKADRVGGKGGRKASLNNQTKGKEIFLPAWNKSLPREEIENAAHKERGGPPKVRPWAFVLPTP